MRLSDKGILQTKKSEYILTYPRFLFLMKADKKNKAHVTIND